ncbi:hypothetical protein GCM10009804_48640 [Kribbella hippodromi]|uniref:Uncharacterized protein n=1 Tax=Kribbella hippodromi TaxID=434347 RepID=A0ABP4PNX0_9ACTN
MFTTRMRAGNGQLQAFTTQMTGRCAEAGWCVGTGWCAGTGWYVRTGRCVEAGWCVGTGWCVEVGWCVGTGWCGVMGWWVEGGWCVDLPVADISRRRSAGVGRLGGVPRGGGWVGAG